MKKEPSKLGLLSLILVPGPLIGVTTMFLASRLTQDNTMIFMPVAIFMYASIFLSPLVGLICGTISLFKHQKPLALPVIGIILHACWIVVIIWAVFQAMLSV